MHLKKKFINVLLVDAVGVNPATDGRIDVLQQVGENLGFGFAQGAVPGAELPADVGPFVGVHISNAKPADTHAGQGQQVNATHAAGSGYGHPCRQEPGLGRFTNQADIP